MARYVFTFLQSPSCFYLTSLLPFLLLSLLLSQGTASLNVAVAGSIVMHRYSVWAAAKRQQERQIKEEMKEKGNEMEERRYKP